MLGTPGMISFWGVSLLVPPRPPLPPPLPFLLLKRFGLLVGGGADVGGVAAGVLATCSGSVILLIGCFYLNNVVNSNALPLSEL